MSSLLSQVDEKCLLWASRSANATHLGLFGDLGSELSVEGRDAIWRILVRNGVVHVLMHSLRDLVGFVSHSHPEK